MPKAVVLALLAPLAAAAAGQKPSQVEIVTVEQLSALVTADQGKSDAETAAELAKVRLTERLPAARLARLNGALPGEKSRQAMVILADSSAFLRPPESEIVPSPTPDATALRKMMVAIVGYVNANVHQLPNFVARRETAAFEDRPAEDIVGAGGAGTVSLSDLPMHFMSSSTDSVTFREGHEVVDGKTASKAGAQRKGLVTAGEFGPFLSTVLADAVKGKITWARWVQGIDGPNAVYHFQVAKKQSNYFVRFCCVAESAAEALRASVYSEQAAYHGEIQFDPATGAILRISVEAELEPGDLVSKAGMVVEYAPQQIGLKTVILPVRSVSLLEAHTTRPRDGMTSPTYTGKPKTFLNDTVFKDYREFRGEARILTGENAEP